MEEDATASGGTAVSGYASQARARPQASCQDAHAVRAIHSPKLAIGPARVRGMLTSRTRHKAPDAKTAQYVPVLVTSSRIPPYDLTLAGRVCHTRADIAATQPCRKEQAAWHSAAHFPWRVDHGRAERCHARTASKGGWPIAPLARAARGRAASFYASLALREQRMNRA